MSNYPPNENNRWLEDTVRNSPGLQEAIRRKSLPEPLSVAVTDFPARPTAEHAQRQIDLADQQVEMLAAMQKLWESQAAEASANAQREAEQQKFNRSMTWVAIILAGAAVVVPFIILWIEQTLPKG
jgi:hypothetical protein